MSRRSYTGIAAAACLVAVTGCNSEDPAPREAPELASSSPSESSDDELCPPSSEWDPESGISPPQDAPAFTCAPGPDEFTEDLIIDSASLSLDERGEVIVDLEVSNTTELSQSMVSAESVRPRIDTVDSVTRLTYMRINFEAPTGDGADGSQVDVGDPGWPEEVYVAAGEKLEYSTYANVDPDIVSEGVQICAYVLHERHPDAPGAQHETGWESSISPRGYQDPEEPVQLTCSEVVELD